MDRIKHFLLIMMISWHFVGLQAHADVLTEDANKLFNELFGEAYSNAVRSPGNDDDIELAKQFIATAPQTKDQPGFAAILCEKAYQLSSKSPEGYEVAIEAMALLAKEDKDKSTEAHDRILVLRQRQYITSRGDEKKTQGNLLLEAYMNRAGELESEGDFNQASAKYRQAYGVANSLGDERKDLIRKKLAELIAKSKIQTQEESLKARLRQNPEDDQIKNDLFKLYIVEMDNPEKAKMYSFLFNKIENAIERLDLLVKPIDELTTSQAGELAAWYFETLTLEASSNLSKTAMLQRAEGYYKYFLDKYDQKDVTRVKATIALQKIEADIKRLNPEGVTSSTKLASGTIDLIKMIDPEQHTQRGVWKKTKNILINEMPRHTAVVAAPVKPDGEYHVELITKRTEGREGIMVNLPLKNDRAITVVLGGREGSGLSNIAGVSYDQNKTLNRAAEILTDKVYHVGITVKYEKENVAVDVLLNKKKIISWKGDLSSAAQARFGIDISPEALGITSYHSVYAVDKFTLKMLNGKVLKPTALGKSNPRISQINFDDVNWNDFRSIKKKWDQLDRGDRFQLMKEMRNQRPDQWKEMMRQLR